MLITIKVTHHSQNFFSKISCTKNNLIAKKTEIIDAANTERLKNGIFVAFSRKKIVRLKRIKI